MILRTACRFGGRYEWAQHIEIGAEQGVDARRAGCPRCDGGGLDTSEWSPLERAALRAVDETADDGAVSDDDLGALAARLDDGELIELLMLIAHYLMLTTVLRSLRIELEPRAEALALGVPAGRRRRGGRAPVPR